MCLNTVFLFVLDLGFGRHVVPHPPAIRTHNTATAVTCGNRREYMRKGARKLEQCRISGGAEKTMYKHNFDSQRKKTCINIVFAVQHGVDRQKNCVYTRFCFGSMLRNMEKTCLYTVLSFMDKVVFIHNFFRFRPKCGIAQASSRLSFPALVPASFSDRLVPTSCLQRPFAWIFDHTC